MIINISITNKRPAVDGAPVIVCNNKGSYTTQFTFDDEWNAYPKKVVRFVWIQKGKVKFKDVEMTGTTCTVPALSNTDKVRVGVFAGDICTTTPAVIPCVRSILCEGGTPSVENDKYYANRARESADRAEVAAGNAAASAATAASEAAEAATAAAEAEVTRLVGELGVVQELGTSPTSVVSQAKVTKELGAANAKIASNSKRITNIEQGLTPDSFETDDSVAYQKDVPANALPYAEVKKIGGMTRKCANIWDEASEQGCLRNGGNSTYVNSELRSSNYISVRPNTTYYTNEGIIVSYYNANKEWVQGSGSEFGYSVNAGTFTTPSDAHYMRFYTMSYGTTYNNDIIIAEGEPKPYEPYFEGLRSAKVTEVKSVGGNLFDYDTYLKNGRKYSFSVIPNKLLYRNPNIGYASGWGVYDNGGVLLGTFETYAFSATSPLQLPSNASYIECTDLSVSESLYIGYDSDTTYRPYTKHILPIPEAVRPANGINENVYDYIEWAEDGSIKKAVKCGMVDMPSIPWQLSTTMAMAVIGDMDITPAWNVSKLPSKITSMLYDGTAPIFYLFFDDGAYTSLDELLADLNGVQLVYELAEPIVTDISDLITADNLIGVEGGGTLTFENEYGYAVPSEVEYQVEV